MAEGTVAEAGALIVILFLIVGYLLGSIPFGLVITRAAGLGDVRGIGSGNIGATNVLRTGRKGLAGLTFLLDALKGSVAVWIALRWGLTPAMAAGFAAFLGHLFPAWLGFKGGKGVSTYIGVLLALAWPALIAFAIVWLAVASLTRYSSLAGMVATLVTPIFLYLYGASAVAALFAVMTILVFWKHRANIERLLAGTESKIGAK
ncbi:MAG: glycerol-3-phosphate 1-O-acyltransferase PlsY [Hyphomicrobiales bacterium]|jgi:glycerol-3-phosphate acyltransferase PlsY|nr:glycerol-3-phosphate 1-O-acyltransferase PlsY [Hyphomicrobiales bacterium]MCO5084982.1 glycerol-3-phosphate 1-O-acyltransferase PlsY [Rhizobiaceae bacterium]